jgi:hypothetical protein
VLEGMSPLAKGPVASADLNATRLAALESTRQSLVIGTPSSSDEATLLNHENPTI